MKKISKFITLVVFLAITSSLLIGGTVTAKTTASTEPNWSYDSDTKNSHFTWRRFFSLL